MAKEKKTPEPGRKRRIKRYIVTAILLTVMVAAAIIVKAIDFGKLTIGFIEKNAHVQIDYGKMKGNLLKGFRIESYKIRFSEADSAYGSFAEINYRLSFIRFGLPTLFEISLVEPTVSITKKKTTGAKPGEFSYPHLNLGLRINVKNGKIIYQNEKTYTVEKISGLIFVDFVGSKLYFSTMNLGFNSPDYGTSVTSVNMAATISRKGIKIRSFKAKGKGFHVDGEAEFQVQEKLFSSILNNVELDLEKLGLYRGRVKCHGTLAYSNGIFQPSLQGDVEAVFPVDRFKFETGNLIDTVVINAFDGEVFQGNFFAQVKFIDLKNWNLETNFRNLNISVPLKQQEPILVNGYLGYQNNKFSGFLSSSADSGIAVDSMYIFGYRDGSQINLDSLIVREGSEILRAHGPIWPDCSLDIALAEFTVNRWNKYAPIKGQITGSAHIAGDIRNWRRLLFSTDITANDVSISDLVCKKFILKAKEFNVQSPIKSLQLQIGEISFKKIGFDSLLLSVEENTFFIRANRSADSLTIAGDLIKDGAGTIKALFLQYRGATVKNTEPIGFDLLNRKIGKFNLAVFGGTINGTLSPVNLELLNLELKEIGKITGLKATMSGQISCLWNDRVINLEGRNINFAGLKNGRVLIKGRYQSRSIQVESLAIADDNNQQVDGNGFLSFKESDFTLVFENVRTWIFPFLKGFMLHPDGSMTGTVRFTGSFEDFKLAGGGIVKDGSFGIKLIGDEFDSVSTSIRFEERKIIFESMQAKVHSVSDTKLANIAAVTGGGYVKLEPRFRVRNLSFDLSFKNAPVQILPYAYGKGSGNFTVGMKELVPYYNGNVSVKEGIIPVEFGMKVEEEPGAKPQDWRMNLKISGERNIWLRNREADIEFGGDIYIIKEHGPLYITGNLETRRGNYYWLNHSLNITEGKVTFVPEAEMIDPELDIWAEMNTHERHQDTGEEIRIKLHFFGPLSEPVFEFFTEPEGMYTEQDILTYLNLNMTWRELESMKQGEYVGQILPKSLLAWLESDVSRRIRAYTGLDYFRIEAPFFETEEKTKLTVGKYISRNLFITYTYDITDFENEFNVEYFIDDRNEIMVRRDETGEYGLEYQYRIRF